MKVEVKPCEVNEGFYVAEVVPLGITGIARHPARAKAFAIRNYADALIAIAAAHPFRDTQELGFHGVSQCPCGGQVISNTGKVMGGKTRGNLSCWSCSEEWNTEFANACRGLPGMLTRTNEAVWKTEKGIA